MSKLENKNLVDGSSTSSMDFLLSPQGIRSRCQQIFLRAQQGQTHFSLHLEQLAAVADLVIAITQRRYPDGQIPRHERWGHLQAGDTGRMEKWLQHMQARQMTKLAQAQAIMDLIVVSVLLDAGAGEKWRYRERPMANNKNEKEYSRSEGLAVASFDLFYSGAFSSDPHHHPWQVDDTGLLQLTLEKLQDGMQVTAENPLLGIEGRLHLLQHLGRTLRVRPIFAEEGTKNTKVICRPGNLLFYLLQQYQKASAPLAASNLLRLILDEFSSIWPSRLHWQGRNMGDVWPYPPLHQKENQKEKEKVALNADPHCWIPFHKLSQWLTYSLLRCVQEAGIPLQGEEELTGLAEYRNGGLFIDMKVLVPRSEVLLSQKHSVDSEVVIEWRALTVALLDLLAIEVRKKLGKTSAELPLSKILEGGTWWAGREMAQKLRPQGTPPLQIVSDGTVF